ncbi:hypothetical protein AVO41_01560 [Thiomicrospira sp. WB1]|nr:hypothetical protein AVO41_01560 [Thiomicrospira sp. WB1]
MAAVFLTRPGWFQTEQAKRFITSGAMSNAWESPHHKDFVVLLGFVTGNGLALSERKRVRKSPVAKPRTHRKRVLGVLFWFVFYTRKK